MATTKRAAAPVPTGGATEYLFFQGADLGNSTFLMRTADEAEATTFARVHHKNPYAPGFVMILTDGTFTRMGVAE